jgi:Fibronectin-attachment protein (FAP)
MDQGDPNSTRRRGLWATLAIATVTSASAIAIALPATAIADPETPTPVPPTTTTAPAPAPATTTTTPPPVAPQAQPGDPNATPPPPPPVDPNAPPPPAVDPNAGRIGNAVGGFSFVLPAGWVESDATHLDYGSELLSKTTGQPPAPGQAPPVANDTRVVMGRLDQKLYASAETSDAKAAVRLGSDMGEFFMPYPGTRINQASATLTGANGITGSASYYEVKFSDPSKPNGQIWTGVVSGPSAGNGPPQRWFVVWLGTSNDPVDTNAATALAQSIQPWAAPAAPAPAPGAPAPAPGAPAPAPGAPAPAPGAPAPAPGAPAPAPAPGQAPAGEVTPTPATPPQHA